MEGLSFGFSSILSNKNFFDLDEITEKKPPQIDSWLVHLHNHFHDYVDSENIYLVMEHCSGSLMDRLRTYGTFTENQARFYIVELILAVIELHEKCGPSG